MREIEFRALSDYKSKWIYGIPVEMMGKAIMLDRHDAVINQSVKKETIGQYTGLKDRNGVKIFEGDIVERFWMDGGIPCVVRKSKVLPKFDLTPIDTEKCGEHCLFVNNGEYLVTGNIHQNKELLEATK